MPQTIVTAFANQKGGVGKTTSAINVAAAVAELGHSVLLVDMDPQGNTTSGIGIRKKSVHASTYEVLIGSAQARDALVKTQYENLSVMPATISLAGAEFELTELDHRESALKRALDTLDGQFEFVFIDCPPSLSMLTVNALCAADGVIIPMPCEYYALEGLSQLMLTIKKVKQLYNPRLSIAGILITMYNGRLNLSAQVLDELKKYYADKLFKTPVARSVKISEAPSFGEPITVYDKDSKGAEAYRDIAAEFIRRVL